MVRGRTLLSFVFVPAAALTVAPLATDAQDRSEAIDPAAPPAPPPVVVETAEPPVPPAPQAHLRVAVNVDGAEVSVDEQVVGQSPLGPIPVGPGPHLVQVTHPGFRPAKQIIRVTSGPLARADIRLTPTPELLEQMDQPPASDGNPWYLEWYTIGSVGALLAAGVIAVIAVSANSEDSPSGIPVPPIE